MGSVQLAEFHNLSVEKDTLPNGGNWQWGSASAALTSGSVHVWRAWLEQAQKSLHRLEPLLAADERLRASRFRFERDRHHFIATRGILRVILGRYLAIPPEQLNISYGPRGKPFLAGPGQALLQFNLSHSQGLALFAFALGGAIGVDVEALRTVSDVDHIAEQFFSASERAHLRSLPAQQKQLAFFHCWTQKEAYIKAVGEGLSMPLDRFDVSVSPDQGAALLRVEGDPEAVARWMVRSLNPAPGFSGALACDGTREVVLWEWNGLDQ